MPKMIALRAMKYATRRLLAGDEFEAKPSLVRALTAIGRARLADPDIPIPTKAPEPEPLPPPPVVPKGINPIKPNPSSILTTPAPEKLDPALKPKKVSRKTPAEKA